LADHGVDTLFGLAGDGNLFFIDYFIREKLGTYVAAAHEAGAVLMAGGYANVSGRVGVATVTHGPALTNTVTALVENVRSRTPIVLIAGDTTSGEKENLQDIDQQPIVLPTGAGFEQVRSPETVADDLAMAMRRALTERRPLVLNVPVEYQWADIDYRPAPLRSAGPQALAPDPAVLDQAMGILAYARRPIVLAGRGPRPPRPGRRCYASPSGSVLPSPPPSRPGTCSAANRLTSASSDPSRTRSRPRPSSRVTASSPSGRA
jgi:thiamine pyrophosphate-dependent acetolactate synthase large subunit-like protein